MGSLVILWVLVLVLLGAFVVLARLVGTLYRRLPARSARFAVSGPDVGSVVQQLQVTDLSGHLITIPSQQKATLLISISPTCDSCRELAPVLRSFSLAERLDVQLVLVNISSDREATRDFLRSQKLEDLSVVESAELPANYKSGAPFAILIDRHGVVKSKGIINRREDLESLFHPRYTEATNRAAGGNRTVRSTALGLK